MHVAALALVAIDPNLPASQFLQSWALEDTQTLREGPGVAYELLWADPYLPGVGYQNMEPWVYDDHGRLFARANWEAKQLLGRDFAAGREAMKTARRIGNQGRRQLRPSHSHSHLRRAVWNCRN